MRAPQTGTSTKYRKQERSAAKAVVVKVEIKGIRQRFISLYIPPKKEFTEEEIRGLLVGPKKIIGRDLNAKNSGWGCRRTDKKGRLLGKIVRETRGLEIFASSIATSISGQRGKRADVIDNFLAFKTSAPWDVRTQFALNSDHFPVTARIGGDSIKEKKLFRIDWKKFKVKTERLGLDREPARKHRISEIASEFTKRIQEVLDKCSSEVPLRRAISSS